LKKSSSLDFASRVVTLSSCAHRGSEIRFHDYNFEKEPYDEALAYSQSKTADLYLATEIERRYSKEGIHGLAVHPGFIHTDLERHIEDTPQGKQFMENPKALHIWKSSKQGAATIVLAAVGRRWEGRGGKYLEDVSEGKPFYEEREEFAGYAAGYASFAFDEQAAGQLWEDSLVIIEGHGKSYKLYIRTYLGIFGFSCSCHHMCQLLQSGKLRIKSEKQNAKKKIVVSRGPSPSCGYPLQVLVVQYHP
jgi:hypothetical protein